MNLINIVSLVVSFLLLLQVTGPLVPVAVGIETVAVPVGVSSKMKLE